MILSSPYSTPPINILVDTWPTLSSSSPPLFFPTPTGPHPLPCSTYIQRILPQSSSLRYSACLLGTFLFPRLSIRGSADWHYPEPGLKYIYEWLHTIFVFLRLGYLNQDCFFQCFPFTCEFKYSIVFFLLSNTTLCTCTTFSLSTIQLRGIYIASSFWVLQIMFLWAQWRGCPCCMNLPPLYICLRVE